jgi:hypothetical protein
MVPSGLRVEKDGQICHHLMASAADTPTGMAAMVGKLCLQLDDNMSLSATFNTTGFSYDLLEAQLYVGSTIDGLLTNGVIDNNKFTDSTTGLAGVATHNFVKALDQCSGESRMTYAIAARVVVGTIESPIPALLEDNTGTHDVDALSMTMSVDCNCGGTLPTPEDSCLMAPPEATGDVGDICYGLMTDGGAKVGEACLKINDGGDLETTFNTTGYGVSMSEAQLFVGPSSDALLNSAGAVDVTKFTSSATFSPGVEGTVLGAVLPSGDECAFANTYQMDFVGRVVISDESGQRQTAHIDVGDGTTFLDMNFVVDCMCQTILPMPTETCIMRPSDVLAREDGYTCFSLRTDGMESSDGKTSAMVGEACLRINAGGNLVVKFDTTEYGGLHEAAIYVGDDHSEVLDANGNIDTSKFTVGKTNMNGAVVETTITALLASGDVCASADTYPMSLVGRIVVRDTKTGELHVAFMEDLAGTENSHLMTLSVDCMCEGYLPTPENSCLSVPSGMTEDSLGRVCYDVMTDTTTQTVAGKACLKIDEGGDLDLTFDVNGYSSSIKEAYVYVGPDTSGLLTDGSVDVSKYTAKKTGLSGDTQTTLKSYLTAGDLCLHNANYTMAIVGQIVVEGTDGNDYNAFIETSENGYLEMSFSVDCMCKQDTCACDSGCYAETDEAWSAVLSSDTTAIDAGCETAFAYFEPATGSCFSEYGINRWGWSIGPLAQGTFDLSFKIYAGAGQCDLSKGVYVGDLLVSYGFDGDLSATYIMQTGYHMRETHLYYGSTPLPQDGGKDTVAPGKYTALHSDMEPDPTTDYYHKSGLSGDIYIVAHAVTCGSAIRRTVMPEQGSCNCICPPEPPSCVCESGCFPVPPPPPQGCESAYAYDSVTGLCFSDLGVDSLTAGAEGWSIGPLDPGTYNYKIYSGAKQCDPSTGVHVGDLEVVYECPPTSRRQLGSSLSAPKPLSHFERQLPTQDIKDYWVSKGCSRCDTPGNEKIRLCHGTSSHKNPYVSICVDENSLGLDSQDHRWGETHGTGNHIYPDGCPGNSFDIPDVGPITIGDDCGLVTPIGEPVPDDSTPGPECVMNATYTALPGYVMQKTHFNVDTDPLEKVELTPLTGPSPTQDIKDFWVSKGCSRCDTKGNEKIRLCHGTSSHKNPYVSICVDENSLGLKSQDHRWAETHGTGNHIYPDGCPGNTFDVPHYGTVTLGEDCSILSNGAYISNPENFTEVHKYPGREVDTFSVKVQHSDSVYISAHTVSCDAVNPPPTVPDDECSCFCPAPECDCPDGCTKTSNLASGVNCDMAFAYDPITSMCFDMLGVEDWGWSVGPLNPGTYTYEIYSGAKDCNVTNAKKVGDMDVTFECARRRRHLPATKHETEAPAESIVDYWVSKGCSRCGTGSEKVQLCHGTSSDKNPYVAICVNENSLGLKSQDHRWGEIHGANNDHYPDGCPGNTFDIPGRGPITLDEECNVIEDSTAEPTTLAPMDMICTVSADYRMLDGYAMEGTDIYVGQDPIPEVAPTDLTGPAEGEDIKDFWVSKGCSRCDTPGNEKVRLCHGTSSQKNPYVSICVDENSLGLGSQDHRWGETHGTGNHIYPDGCPGNTFDVEGHGRITLDDDCSIVSHGHYIADPSGFTAVHKSLEDGALDSYAIEVPSSDPVFITARASACDAACGCDCPASPTFAPTVPAAPTASPTASPTGTPSTSPTESPYPSGHPTLSPTDPSPTASPTKSPTSSPTGCQCSDGCLPEEEINWTENDLVNGCETAFAYAEDPLGTCFITGFDYNRWGWSVGPLKCDGSTQTFKIYAAAGQCDITKGVYAGDLVFTCAGGTATVTFESTTNLFKETHMYVGHDQVYTDKGKQIFAPGKYPQTHDSVGGYSDGYTFTGLSEKKDVYLVAHASVCGGTDQVTTDSCGCICKSGSTRRERALEDDSGFLRNKLASSAKVPTPMPTAASTFCTCPEDCFSEHYLKWSVPTTSDYIGCETAYAASMHGSCFTDYSEISPARWGWSIGPIDEGEYQFDIFSGAAECDRSNGRYVGILTVNYSGDTMTISYDTFENFDMTETHVYIGDVPMPKDDAGSVTLCPDGNGGGCSDHHIVNGATDSYTITGVSGPKYIIAHSVTCGKEGTGRYLEHMGGCNCFCPDHTANSQSVPRHVDVSGGIEDSVVKCTTAFGYHSDKLSNRLKDMGMSPMMYDGNDVTWGWSNGPFSSSIFAYSMDLYAEFDGKGTSVGSMSVAYDGEEAVVTVEAGERLWLKELHAYVGTEPLPMTADGKQIVDPAEFPIVHKRMSLSRTVNVENLGQSPIYVVTEATVCGVFGDQEKAEEKEDGSKKTSFFRRLFS